MAAAEVLGWQAKAESGVVMETGVVAWLQMAKGLTA
jgi:hypothetical protein